MASVIILVFGENRHLVLKPASYSALIDVARFNFPDLHMILDDNITFHFTPEWFDDEVKLDRDTLAEVHNRAVLRIITTASALDEHSRNDGGKVQDDDNSDPILGYRYNLSIIQVPTYRKLTLSVKPRSKLCRLEEAAATFFGVNRLDHHFHFDGLNLKNFDTPESMGMEDGDVIKMDNEFF